MAWSIGIFNDSQFHIYFDNAKATNEVGIDAIDTYAVDSLVAYDTFVVEVADINDITIGFYQVDIGVLIDSNEALSLLVPTDMGDISIRESVGLIVGVDALVFLIILIEVVRAKYCNNSSCGYNGFMDNRTVLDPEDDAAAVNWGGKWRTPTYDEFDELKTQCSWTWTTLNGVYGRKVTSNKEGYTNKWIFLPATGHRTDTSLYGAGSYAYYWSSSLNTGSPYDAYNVYFNSKGVSSRCDYRYGGLSVRPVQER